jgi:hypothetical protein
MNKNYKLLVIDRYDIGQSNCYILPEDFFKQFKKKNLKGSQKVEGGFMGCDTEEESYLWTTTDQKVNNKSKLYMDDVYDIWEEDEEWD